MDQVEHRRVIRVHQHRVTRRAVDRVHLGIDERVELLAATGGDAKVAGGVRRRRS